MPLFRRRGEKKEGEPGARLIDQLLPERLKLGRGRFLDSLLPKGGVLPDTKKAEGRKMTVADSAPDYVADKTEQYRHHLEAALKVAPCSGCKNLTVASLVGLEIFKQMEQQGKAREDFTDVEVERIRKQVEARYGG